MHTVRRTLGATSLVGDGVLDVAYEEIGKIKELMIDVETGKVAYAVLAFGGTLGVGAKLFALPWSLLRVDESRKCFIADVAKDKLEELPGFDKGHWPDLDEVRFPPRREGGAPID
jgi:hypothetical protein